MRFRSLLKLACVGLVSISSWAAENEFTSLFNGKNLHGWKLIDPKGSGYVVRNGIIVCPEDGGGNLFTEKTYENFVFRFEFKLSANGNNGIGIRAPLYGDAAYLGMEIQVLDDSGSQYQTLRPEQYHGSVYDVAAARQGALRPVGEWNEEEIRAEGRWITVTLNGQVINTVNLNDVIHPEKLAKHPGVLRPRGHIGFLGHGTLVEFRNPRIQELPSSFKPNTSPYPGFVALYNGKDLKGWKGLLKSPYDNPVKRTTLVPEDRRKLQIDADERMNQHWKSESGELVFDGKGDSLCTLDQYADFELFVDWKIADRADSGIYLRGAPQVQIWDPTHPEHGSEVGSGGLYNNQKYPSKPTVIADRPVGTWNTFHIIMQGEKVSVFLNDQLVTWNVTLENYWDRNSPIFSKGQIELQNHGNTLWFRNIYLRQLP